jgi:hypothetical protein
MLYIDPNVAIWLLFFGASACAFMVGKLFTRVDQETIIDRTIQVLIDRDFVKYKILDDGEIELLPVND